jgi:hypothetical protein
VKFLTRVAALAPGVSSMRGLLRAAIEHKLVSCLSCAARKAHFVAPAGSGFEQQEAFGALAGGARNGAEQLWNGTFAEEGEMQREAVLVRRKELSDRLGVFELIQSERGSGE